MFKVTWFCSLVFVFCLSSFLLFIKIDLHLDPLSVILCKFLSVTKDLGCVSQKHRKPKLIVAPLVLMGLRCT